MQRSGSTDSRRFGLSPLLLPGDVEGLPGCPYDSGISVMDNDLCRADPQTDVRKSPLQMKLVGDVTEAEQTFGVS